MGCGIDNDARFSADRDTPCLLRRKKERHVDVGYVDHVQDAATSLHDLARLGDKKLDAAVTRGAKHAIVNVCLNTLDRGACGLDLSFRL